MADDLTIDPYRDIPNATELMRLRRTLAKRANQRLVRLERSVSEVTGESYASFGAADIAYAYTKAKTGRKRFSEQLNWQAQDINAIRHEVVVLQGFLSSKSSTVSGQRQIEEKRILSFERGEWGVKWKTKGVRQQSISFASNKEFYDFLSSTTFKELIAAGFTSDFIVEQYNTARSRNPDDEDRIIEEMNKALEEYRESGNLTMKDFAKRLGNPIEDL